MVIRYVRMLNVNSVTFSLGFVSRNVAIFRLINETDRRAAIEICVLL